jgi:hypothetical protein
MSNPKKFENHVVNCAYCSSNLWRTYLDTDSNGRTHLLICCANEECAATQSRKLGARPADDVLVISFDVVVDDAYLKDIQLEPEVLN